MAYKPIIFPCISFILFEMKLIHCYSSAIFLMKSISICNDELNYDEIIIQ